MIKTIDLYSLQCTQFNNAAFVQNVPVFSSTKTSYFLFIRKRIVLHFTIFVLKTFRNQSVFLLKNIGIGFKYCNELIVKTMVSFLSHFYSVFSKARQNISYNQGPIQAMFI
jgi:hypothetical protein